MSLKGSNRGCCLPQTSSPSGPGLGAASADDAARADDQLHPLRRPVQDLQAGRPRSRRPARPRPQGAARRAHGDCRRIRFGQDDPAEHPRRARRAQRRPGQRRRAQPADDDARGHRRPTGAKRWASSGSRRPQRRALPDGGAERRAADDPRRHGPGAGARARARAARRWSAWRTAWTPSRTVSPAASSSAWRSPSSLANDPPLLLADEPTGELD